jgi:hypothetical protein
LDLIGELKLDALLVMQNYQTKKQIKNMLTMRRLKIQKIDTLDYVLDAFLMQRVI